MPRLSAIITLERSTLTREVPTLPAQPPVRAAGSVLPILQQPPIDQDSGEDSGEETGEETGEFTVVDVRVPESMPPFTPWPRSSFVPFAPRPAPAAEPPARAPRATPPPPWSRRRRPGLPSWPVVGSPAPATSPHAPHAAPPPPAPSPAPSPPRASITRPTRLLRKR